MLRNRVSQFVRLRVESLMCVMMLCLGGTSFAMAEELSWPDRGGPTFNGHVAPADAQGLPTTWNENSGKNIAWKVALEGQGHSTPVIGCGRIWFTSATEDGKQQFIECLDEESGATIHHQLLFENSDPEPLGNPINTYASPSCVLTTDAVFVHFGTYGTARLDPQTADVVWQRRDINGRHFRGPGSSPVLYDDLLILTFDCIDQQFLIALNIHTGKTVWRTDRTTDYGDLDENGLPKREGDLRKAYSTPALAEVAGRVQVISPGSRAAFGYDARTGEELWTITHDDYNAAARPSIFRNHAIINTGSRGANLISVKLDESTRGNVDQTHVVWNRERGNSRLSTPLLHDGLIYMVTDTGVAICVDAQTGDEVWTDRIGGTFVASPIVANGLIYFCNEEGVTTLIRAGRQFEVVARNELSEGMRASPAAANGAMYLRTFGHLYKLAAE